MAGAGFVPEQFALYPGRILVGQQGGVPEAVIQKEGRRASEAYSTYVGEGEHGASVPGNRSVRGGRRGARQATRTKHSISAKLASLAGLILPTAKL